MARAGRSDGGCLRGRLKEAARIAWAFTRGSAAATVAIVKLAHEVATFEQQHYTEQEDADGV